MSSVLSSKLTLSHSFVLLLVAPLCLLSLQSSWISTWDLDSQSSSGHLAQTNIHHHLRNKWTMWTSWSVCSRSCGSGAAVRRRSCTTSNPVGGPCGGESRQYKICNTKACPPSSEDFREMQCAAFNDRPLAMTGNSFKWTTFHEGPNPCELSCLAMGHNFYYNFGSVLDGTPCDNEPGAVCANGHCMKPGCDSILGSKQQEDACMVCGGKNATCVHHKSVYLSNGLEAGGPFGYNEVAMIPAGATNIRVTDNSKNYLALQNNRLQFVINGNWKISIPGEYNVAGTKLLYRRSADTWESFEVPGPTQENLHLMVLATVDDTGIEYEYWLPPDQYALYHGRKSSFSQAHNTANYPPLDRPTSIPLPSTKITITNRAPSVTTVPQWWYCGKCQQVKGRKERQKQYCQKDFVFRGRVLGKFYQGEETRYDIQVIHTYRNSFRLEHREFLWAPNVCDCPHLEKGKQYVLMVRRHINNEHTLNRILLEEDSYIVPYKPRVDELLQPLERLCRKRGSRQTGR